MGESLRSEAGTPCVLSCGELYEGTYFLFETTSPEGYEPAGYAEGARNYYVLKVEKDGTQITGPRIRANATDPLVAE